MHRHVSDNDNCARINHSTRRSTDMQENMWARLCESRPDTCVRLTQPIPHIFQHILAQNLASKRYPILITTLSFTTPPFAQACSWRVTAGGRARGAACHMRRPHAEAECHASPVDRHRITATPDPTPYAPHYYRTAGKYVG